VPLTKSVSMNAPAILYAAILSLQRASIRSALTALGVIVGVAAVVTTTSIGNGARSEIQETLSKPESRTISLGAIIPPHLRRAGAKLALADSLKRGDYDAIRHEIDNVSAVSPRIYVSAARAQANGRATDITLEGVDVEGFATVPRQLLDGAFFNDFDVRQAANVCVISESLARMLYPAEQQTNRAIRINDARFTVIGVVDDVPNLYPMFRAADLHVYVPFTSLLRRLDSTAQMSISVQASDIEYVGVVQQRIGDVMEQRRSGRKALFLTNNAFDSIKTYADGSRTVSRLLAAVGIIALIVGGIGIMNIMLASVRERTREIGIRMAIGTRSRDIRAQFLTEAIVLSLLGGGLGIAIGWAASWFVTRLNDWPTDVTTSSIVVALLCSAGIGVFFGYHPARRAALLHPVEALRTE
jgi:putative ABC transport system permease protein